jgi:hypothetical protein
MASVKTGLKLELLPHGQNLSTYSHYFMEDFPDIATLAATQSNFGPWQ